MAFLSSYGRVSAPYKYVVRGWGSVVVVVIQGLRELIVFFL